MCVGWALHYTDIVKGVTKENKRASAFVSKQSEDLCLFRDTQKLNNKKTVAVYVSSFTIILSYDLFLIIDHESWTANKF